MIILKKTGLEIQEAEKTTGATKEKKTKRKRLRDNQFVVIVNAKSKRYKRAIQKMRHFLGGRRAWGFAKVSSEIFMLKSDFIDLESNFV